MYWYEHVGVATLILQKLTARCSARSWLLCAAKVAGMQPQDAPPELRNLRETLAAHQQEVQDTHAWLKRTYAALDEQAAQAAHESIDRYLRNAALLARVFAGPGCPPEPLGGRTDIADLAARLKEAAAASTTSDAGGGDDAGKAAEILQPDQHQAEGQADIREFLVLLERIRGASSEADLGECQMEYERQSGARKRQRAWAGAQVPGEDAAQESGRKRTETLVSPGLSKVELSDDEQPGSWGGEQDSPIRL